MAKNNGKNKDKLVPVRFPVDNIPRGKNANYNFAIQDEPAAGRMGDNQHANLPQEVISRPYGPPSYRDGIINSYSASIEDISKIHENEVDYPNGHAQG